MKDQKEVYFELAQSSSMRTCLKLEKTFSDFRKRQLEHMMNLCRVAYNSQIYDGVCEDAWLRTTITIKSDCWDVFPHCGSPELVEAGSTVLCQASWEWLQRELDSIDHTSRIEIRSNILPRGAYRERLQELVKRHPSLGTRVLRMLLGTPCCLVSRRGFFPITIINQAREMDVPLKQKLREWRRDGGRCELAMHLLAGCVVPETERIRTPIRENIKRRDLTERDQLGVGAEATVYKVSWRNGTYAMKSYERWPASVDPSARERQVASTVLHPHIVYGFGFYEADGQFHLLMEMLEHNLTKYLVEQLRVGVKPPFSRANALDVLLQIAKAVEHLHRNEIVHGDLKPGNILLDHFEISGNERHFLAKVTDFGEAQFLVRGRPFSPGGGGTTNYAAPELLMFREYQRRRSTSRQGNSNQREIHASSPAEGINDPKKLDVYSFGGIAHDVLTGYPVYPERDKSEFGQDFKDRVKSGNLKPIDSKVWRNSGLRKRHPSELIDLVEKCWQLHPEDRPTFSEICEVLERCKSTVQNGDCSDFNHLKLIAFVLLIVLMSCLSSLVQERTVADPLKFLALTHFAFIFMSYVWELLFAIGKKVLMLLGKVKED